MISGPSIGVVGVPGGWSTEALADALERRTGKRLVIDMARVTADLARGRVHVGDQDLCDLDALLIKKVGDRYSHHMLDRLELLRYVAARGVRVMSPPGSILKLFDRLSCTVTLAAGGVPMPETTVTEDLGEAERVVRRYGAAVLKPLYSTKARGMEVVDATSGDDVPGRLEAFRSAGNPALYIQRRLPAFERDLGVVFLGGEHVGTYARVRRTGSWNTTTRAGGEYQPYAAPREVIEVAHAAQALFGLDLTSVDVVETPDGPQVFEVSAFGGFRGCLTALGLDLAELYAAYALERVGK